MVKPKIIISLVLIVLIISLDVSVRKNIEMVNTTAEYENTINLAAAETRINLNITETYQELKRVSLEKKLIIAPVNNESMILYNKFRTLIDNFYLLETLYPQAYLSKYKNISSEDITNLNAVLSRCKEFFYLLASNKSLIKGTEDSQFIELKGEELDCIVVITGIMSDLDYYTRSVYEDKNIKDNEKWRIFVIKSHEYFRRSNKDLDQRFQLVANYVSKESNLNASKNTK
jgi:hypothetical protein